MTNLDIFSLSHHEGLFATKRDCRKEERLRMASTNQLHRKGWKTALRWMASLMLLVSFHAFGQSAGTITYVYTDQQGTPLAETDASGNITATFEYTPYGTFAPNGTSSPGADPNGPGYTGHVNDPETNLVYMQARYYDPATGRFLSVDPIGLSSQTSFEIARYTYAGNNPIGNSDPTGAFTEGMTGGQIECEVYSCQITGSDSAQVQRAQTAMNEANDALKDQGVLGHPYDAENNLVTAWANAVVPVTKRMRVELQSDIMYLQNSGFFSSAAYSTGNQTNVDVANFQVKVQAAGKKVAEIHTHPFNNEFSGMTAYVMPFDPNAHAAGQNYCCDLNRYYGNGIDGYVAMPNGSIYGWNYRSFKQRADEHGPTTLGSGVFTVRVGH
ncbi:RHS repeat-associated core domain-containing protein [Dyella sp. 2HG41-7]|uniref:RHS repeat-associated core domain-containing protein n=1 Tax=Dyella sp. 2HG41-7 TaxID=2883239 RepID=UPI001F3E0DAE|nr:RHS repeat-associated core domain-containing protein [Dyella sp. 2HG41-7]